jgi:hypothetical protein
MSPTRAGEALQLQRSCHSPNFTGSLKGLSATDETAFNHRAFNICFRDPAGFSVRFLAIYLTQFVSALFDLFDIAVFEHAMGRAIRPAALARRRRIA